MQILPATAYFIAHLSGGARFNASDLATPSINVAYGSYYLRYLLDHYNGNQRLALAAYNAGEDAVERYGHSIPPFAETQHYVPTVLRIYRSLLNQQRPG